MTNTDTIAALRTTDNDFARSLVRQWDRKGRLSDRQWSAARRMLSRPAPVATERIAFDGIAALFARASSADHGRPLKRARITLRTADGKGLALSVAGDRSRYPGHVHVSDGGDYGSNVYYGRIAPTGEFFGRETMPDSVRTLLGEFAADPVPVAIAYGRLTGACCFCQKTLTDARSVTVGYGPVCADNYGLPWGV